MLGRLGAVSLKKSHDIVILSFCNIVKGQANYALPDFGGGIFYAELLMPS